jgi:Flp pilus assembly protein CpaB
VLSGASWRRIVLLRRIAAGLLVLMALLIALRPSLTAEPREQPVLVASRDLPPGVALRRDDVVLRTWPAELVPAAVLHDPSQVEGRLLAGAARAGEPLTDLRLASQELARLATGSADTASVPIRLTDAAVASLLRPGMTVDVVAAGEQPDSTVVLAAGAVVLTVLAAENGPANRGRLVLVALPRSAASRVASAALAQPVTVTLR